MHWLALAVLGACSFSPGQLRGDGGGGGADDATDGPGSDAMLDPDAMLDAMVDATPDAPPVNPAKVRAIDVVDAQVTGGPHADFPMLVSLTEPWLATTSNGGDVATGTDIYFSADQGGTQQLAHDVEVYTATGTLVAWVKVPSLETSTLIYLHYGDPAITTSQENVTQTWSGGYALVAHMDGSGDATGQAATPTGTNVGSVAAGRFGPASSFNGSDSNLQFGSDTELDNLFNGGATIEAWVFADTYGESSRGRIFEKGEENGWVLFVDNANTTNSVTFGHGWTTQAGAWPATSNSLPVNGWHHVVVTYDNGQTSNNPTMIIDGTSVSVGEVLSPSGSKSDDSSFTLYVGNNPTGSRTFDGNLDELRLSTAPRSTGWIQTQYRNQADPANFYAVSAPL